MDNSRNKNYYHSYEQSDDETIGNISCVDLPPFQDIYKARACYWNSDSAEWVFDDEKYSDILTEQAEIKAEMEKEAAKNAATPSNEELAEGLIELAENVANHNNTILALEEKVAKLMEGVVS